MLKSKWFDYCFVSLGLLIQAVVFAVTWYLPDFDVYQSTLSFLCGCLGVCSVWLTAQRNIWMYLFGFGQVGIYLWLCVQQRFYGGIAINSYYLLTMVYGVFVWRRHLDETDHTLTIRGLPVMKTVLISIATIVGSWLTGWGLSYWTDDTQPYLDAFTTIPALVGQVLMILGLREHWLMWLAVDVLGVVLWVRAGDGCMTAQYAFWTANCVYGLYLWRSSGVSKE